MDRVRLFKAVTAVTAAASVLLALSLAVFACGSGGSAANPSGGGAAGSSLAPSFSGLTLEGKQVSLEQYRGKPLILVYMTYT